jgi:hypothetical protein
VDLGDLLRWIVPAIILISLALNQILGKEEPRPVRGPAQGPRPGGLPPAPRPPASRDLGNAKSRPNAPAEEVFIIRAEPTTPMTRAAQARQAKRAGKPRQATRGIEPNVKPGGLAQPNLGGLAAQSPVAATLPTPIQTGLGPPIGQEVTGLLSSPQRLREAFLASVVLGPPVSKRSGQ